MADIQTQLPVKVTDGTNTVVVTGANAFKVDGSSVTQPVSGTITNVPSGTQAVAGTVTAIQATAANLNAAVVGTLTHNGAAPATNAVAILPAIATVAAPTYSTGSVVALSTDTSGNLRVVFGGTQTVTGTVTTVPSGTQAVSGTTTVVQATAANLNAVVTGSGTAGSPASGVITVQGDPSGTPIPVTQGETTTGIVAFQATTSTVASSSTATMSYTVTAATTLLLKQVFASSSGAPCKVTVDYGAGPTILAVGFYSSASPYLDLKFAQPPAITAGTVVNVKIQNNAGAAQDVYASIFGLEI